MLLILHDLFILLTLFFSITVLMNYPENYINLIKKLLEVCSSNVWEASIVAQFSNTTVAPAFLISTPMWVTVALLLIQLPANKPRKAEGDSPRVCALAKHVSKLVRVVSFCIQPDPASADAATWRVKRVLRDHSPSASGVLSVFLTTGLSNK